MSGNDDPPNQDNNTTTKNTAELQETMPLFHKELQELKHGATRVVRVWQ